MKLDVSSGPPKVRKLARLVPVLPRSPPVAKLIEFVVKGRARASRAALSTGQLTANGGCLNGKTGALLPNTG